MRPLKALRHWHIQHPVKRCLAITHTASNGRPSIEEETLSHYHASHYYPVHLDQTFYNRYKVAAKLGFGGSSTVWLCEDLACVPPMSFCGPLLNETSDKTYKTLKFGVRSTTESQEVKILRHLKEIKSSNDGRYCVRRVCDFFEIDVPDNRHHCIVFEPLGMSLLDYVTLQRDHTLNSGVAKWDLTYLLKAVDYLHTSGVVHTGMLLENPWTESPLMFLQTSSLITSKTRFLMRRLRSLHSVSTLNGRNRVLERSSMRLVRSTPLDHWSTEVS